MGTLSARLTRCKDRSGLSFRDLEQTTGASFSNLSKLHREEIPATMDNLARLALVYHTTIEYLRDGNPRVNAWRAFRDSHLYDKSNGGTRTDRTIAVLDYLNDTYSGHLNYKDVARILDVREYVVDNIRSKASAPAPGFVQALAELAGIPAVWVEHGDTPRPEQAEIDGLPPYVLNQLLALARQAKALDMIHQIDQLGAILAKAKESQVPVSQIPILLDMHFTEKPGRR